MMEMVVNKLLDKKTFATMIPLTWTDSFQIQKSLVSKISENPKRCQLIIIVVPFCQFVLSMAFRK